MTNSAEPPLDPHDRQEIIAACEAIEALMVIIDTLFNPNDDTFIGFGISHRESWDELEKIKCLL